MTEIAWMLGVGREGAEPKTAELGGLGDKQDSSGTDGHWERNDEE